MRKINFTKSILLQSFLICTVLPIIIFAGQRDDLIFKAMEDELQRSISELSMEELEKPYFISYTIDDSQDLRVTGVLGTITGSELSRSRYLTVDLRVGDYALDNSNFVSGYYKRGPDFFAISIEDDYDAIRNKIYLSTDKVYKNALKTLSKKKAYLQTRVFKNRPDDFIKQPANKYNGKTQPQDIDQVYFNDLIKSSSSVLSDYPMIISSELSLLVGVINQYFVNSNGSKSLKGDRLYIIDISLDGKSEEGEDIKYADHFIVRELKDIPDKKKLAEWVKANADRMKSFLVAETIEEYTGPVIFYEDAAGEFFRQLFAKNISNCPFPLYENEEVAKMYSSPAFENKIKRRVLPAFFNVYDDPTIDRFGSLNLFGGYKVDDAGGVPKKVELVKNGKLINQLIGMAPTKKIKEPNGHARGAVSKDVTAKPGNLIFESNDKASFKKLKKTMLEMCQDFDLEYGLLIKRLENPNAPQASYYFYGAQSSNDNALTVPIEVYKIYSDGRQVPVRNLEFSNITVRALRDILQTGDESYVYSYLVKNDFEMPVSIVCPAVLIEEMELKKSEAKIKKPPLLPSPLAEQ